MLPLTEKVRFSTQLQMGNRIQVPKNVRWRFKMDSDQVLKVSMIAFKVHTYGWQSFYARMGRDGRITIPKVQRRLLLTDEQRRYVMDVILEPV